MKREVKYPASKVVKCPKCGQKTYHTLIDLMNGVYRCSKCGTCHA